MDAEHLIKRMGLLELPGEGGYYKETYRSEEKHEQGRCLSTAIYYLLTSKENSKMHRLHSDEVFHFYFGDPVQMLLLYPSGESQILFLGSNMLSGQKPQVIVPKGTWQGSMVVEGDYKYALMGTTAAPGFEFEDFELAEREELVKIYPQYKGLIEDLT